MRGVIAFADGSSFTDADQTFTTGALPANIPPVITATTTAGMTPQPGVEMLDLASTSAPRRAGAQCVTDLAGNVIWTYNRRFPGVMAQIRSSCFPMDIS